MPEWMLTREEKTVALNLLTEEKIGIPIFDEDYFDAGSQAQARKIAEKLDICLHERFDVFGLRLEINKFMAEFKKEAGL